VIDTDLNLATEQLARNVCAASTLSFEGLEPDDQRSVLEAARVMLDYYPPTRIAHLAETRRNLTRRATG
jgi:hypothetical protein